MKNVKMFGKSVPLIAILIASMLVIGGSASLVNYLSGQARVSVAVSSPLIIGGDMYLGHPGGVNGITPPDGVSPIYFTTETMTWVTMPAGVHAGDTVYTVGFATNLANNPMRAVGAMVIPAPAGSPWTTTVTGEEETLNEMSLEFRYAEGWEAYDYGKNMMIYGNYLVILTGGWFDDGDLVTSDDDALVPALDTINSYSTLTFASGVEPGTFKFYFVAVTEGTPLGAIPGLAGAT